MKFGQRLKSIRIEKGISIIEIAENLNISESTYRRYETDRSFPDIFLLCRIAEIFDKKINNLLPEYMVDINENSNTENSKIIKYLSEKIIEQYEERLEDKDCQIALLKSILEKCSSTQ